MTTRLYIRRPVLFGGDHIELTDDYGPRRGAPFMDGDRSLVELGMRCAEGAASQGTFLFTDPYADPDYEPFATSFPLAHNLVTWTEDAPGSEVWLFRGRVANDEGGRGEAVVDNETEWEITVDDCNVEMRGQAFTEHWIRPEETDVARLIALGLYTFNGASSTAPNSRDSCVVTVSSSHLVPATNTVTMPAKKYVAGSQPQDVIKDCAEMAGKNYAIVIHHTGGSHLCLFYTVPGDHTTYVSPITISDHVTDWDPEHPTNPVFEPHWERGSATIFSMQQMLSGMVGVWGSSEETFFIEDTAVRDNYEYWVEGYHAGGQTAAEAEDKAAGVFFQRKQLQVTHRASIIMKANQVHMVGAGMTLLIRTAATHDPDVEAYITRRIVECRFEPRNDGRYWCHMDIERPLLLSPHGPGYTGPIPPVQPVDPGGPITDFYWSFDSDHYDDTTGLHPVGGGAANSQWHPGYVHSHVIQPGFETSGPLPPITGGTTYTVTADIGRNPGSPYNPGGIRLEVYTDDGSGPWFSNYVDVGATGSGATTTVGVTATPGALATVLGWGVPYNSSFCTQATMSHGTAGTGLTGSPTPLGPTPGGSLGTSPIYSPNDHQHDVQDATETPILDEGGYFESANVEEALTELAAGAAANRPHSHPDYAESAVALTASPGGGWQWIQEPRVINHKGYVYWGAVRGDNGDITVRVVEEADPTGSFSEVVLNSALAADVHNTPVFCVRDSDHKLMVWYSDHNGAALYQRVSTNSLDTDPTLSGGFAAETDIDSQLTGSLYTYVSVLQLANEDLFLIVRAVSATQDEWHYSTSTNDGTTWAALTKFVDEPGGKFPYVKMSGHPDGTRLDFCMIDDHPFDSNNSVWHFYWEGGTFYGSDGVALTLPITSSTAYRVYDGSATAAWIWDIATGLDGYPRIVYSYPDTGTNHVYVYARWTGASWASTDVADSIGEIIGGQPGGIALDRTEPSIVYLIRSVGGELEPFRAASFDGGRNWQLDPLATDSEGVNITPAAVHVPNPDSRVDSAVRAMWLTGSYTDFDDYAVGVAAAVTLTTAGAESSVSGGVGEILISDTPSTPLVFADLLQNEAQNDLIYADT